MVMGSSDGMLAFKAWCSLETHANTPFVLVNNMQTPPPSKVAILSFWPKKLRNVLEIMKNKFSDFQFLRYGRSNFLE